MTKIPCGGFELGRSLLLDSKKRLEVNWDESRAENFEVAITLNDDNDDGIISGDDSIISNKTFAEISEAFYAGKNIYALCTMPDGSQCIFYLLFFLKDEKIMFSEIMDFNLQVIVIENNDNISFYSDGSLPPTPLSPDDDGKFVCALNGMYELTHDIIIPSSTSGSTKLFKITVDDSGTISAIETT